MEIRAITKDGKQITRFKVPLKQLNIYKKPLEKYVDINNPVKKNSRFIYFECDGNLVSLALKEALGQ